MYIPRFKRLGPDFNAFNEMHRLHREMDRLFNRCPNKWGTRHATAIPAVNMVETGDAVVLEMEVPGYDPKNLDVTIQDDTISIKGTHPEKETGDDEILHRKERFAGDFHRVLELPFKINHDAVTASYKNGILTMKMPRAEEDKPKSIKITVE
jgi:HSP20 family protein